MLERDIATRYSWSNKFQLKFHCDVSVWCKGKTHSFDLLIISNVVKLDIVRVFCENAEVKRLYLSQMSGLLLDFSLIWQVLSLDSFSDLFCVLDDFYVCWTETYCIHFFCLVKLLCVKAQIKANRDRDVKKLSLLILVVLTVCSMARQLNLSARKTLVS